MTIAVSDWSTLDESQRDALLRRPRADRESIRSKVSGIISAVRARGDDALREFGAQFDGVTPGALQAGQDQIALAPGRCQPDLLAAIDRASNRIARFHEAAIPVGSKVETSTGLMCESRYLPISPVGLYVPGGSAPLVSTVMMLAIPARLAGCGQIVLCTPPGPDGSIAPAILAAAGRCGIETVFAIGGAQAIAAMAYGTRSVPKCAKIFGPGNAWVTEAKQQVSADPDGAAQDLPAGPSEVLVIADDSADPGAVCWDLLSQAEHGPDSQVILLSDSRTLLDIVMDRIEAMAQEMPRADILQQSLKNLSLILAGNRDEALAISNRYAPEHLVLNCEGGKEMADKVTAAGSVFIGPWTPESLGDYASGTNHVLPTYGYARAYGGLSVIDFMRRMTLQTATPAGLEAAGPDAMTLAASEGLDAHRMAVQYRLDQL